MSFKQKSNMNTKEVKKSSKEYWESRYEDYRWAMEDVVKSKPLPFMDWVFQLLDRLKEDASPENKDILSDDTDPLTLSPRELEKYIVSHFGQYYDVFDNDRFLVGFGVSNLYDIDLVDGVADDIKEVVEKGWLTHDQLDSMFEEVERCLLDEEDYDSLAYLQRIQSEGF